MVSSFWDYMFAFGIEDEIVDVEEQQDESAG